jgi:hypothetical protein
LYSSCSCARLSPTGQHGVVRPGTSVQFQKHVVSQYTVGRLFSGTLPLRFSPFSYGVVRQPAHGVSIVGSPSSSVQAERLFDSGVFRNTLLEPISVKHFLPKHELSTEDDGEPEFGMASSRMVTSFTEKPQRIILPL